MMLRQDLADAAREARARVRFAFPWWLRPFLMRGVAGITLGRRIYLAPNLREEQVGRFVAHELAHVRQIARHGLLGFYWRYLLEYLRNRRRGMSSGEAYRAISFEMEALAAEKTYNPTTATGP